MTLVSWDLRGDCNVDLTNVFEDKSLENNMAKMLLKSHFENLIQKQICTYKST